METSFFDSNLIIYFIMPLLIFLARICDVSIGTMRIIFFKNEKSKHKNDLLFGKEILGGH